jgi:outer membrane receptor protein involved in Fe transport
MLLNGLFGGSTGKVAGRVVDAETGEPLIAANILIEEILLGAATDMDGNYTILNIPPGTYTLKAMMIGYRTNRVLNVEVSVDFTTRVDFELAPSVLEMESVDIIAVRPIIQKDLTSSRATIGAETISEMPVETYEDVLELQAGIVKGADNRIHIRGGRASEVVHLIDGLPVNDPFSNEVAVTVENDAIQELQVISGTFNAEYGQAMSGVIDIVTKEGGNRLAGRLSAYFGDHLSSATDLFPGIDRLSPGGLWNLQGNLSGPVPLTGGKLTYFVSGRYYAEEGWIYGRRWVTPGYLDRTNPDSVFWAVEPGDSALVPMNSSLRIFAQGKFTFRPVPKLKLSYSAYWNRSNYRVYDHLFRFNPDGDYRHFKDGLTQIFTLNHTLSSKTFYTLKVSQTDLHYQRYVFKDPLDTRYVDVEAYKGRFYDGGTKLWHIERTTLSRGGKFDLTSQITNNHQIKTGLEFRKHTLDYTEFKVLLDNTADYRPTVGADVPGNTQYNDYTQHPVEAAAYFQDKMEFEEMIINAGIRVDYFDPAWKVPTDLRDPDNAKYFYVLNRDSVTVRIPERDYDSNSMTILDTVDILDAPWVYKYKRVKPLYQVSPRIGIAYPITDRGVIHFSYGHFTQIPSFQYLYHNSEFEVRPGPLNKDEGKGVFDKVFSADPETEGNIMGNASFKPQQTVSYELGIQQQISDNVGVDVTGFYKDMRNLVGTEIIEMYDTRLYARYVNRDYGNVRGITVALKIRPTGVFSGAVDYTYQIAEGNASDPNDAFLDAIGGRESEVRVVPLDWDQTHTLNFNLTWSQPHRWGVSVLGKLGSGLPYTYEPPQTGAQYTRFENNVRKPLQITFDLNAHWDVSLGKLRGSFFLKVYNLFDRRNEIAVYNDTGRAGYTVRTRYWGEWQDIGTVADWINRPHMYSQPRRVVAGFNLKF